MGRHVRQSCTKAARWVAVAAEADNAAARYNLGCAIATAAEYQPIELNP